MDPLDGRCSFSPALSLAPSPFAPVWSSWLDPDYLSCQGLLMGPVTSPQICPPQSDPVGLHPWVRARLVPMYPRSQLPQLTAEATARCHAGWLSCPQGLGLGHHITGHRLSLTGRTRELLNRGPTTLRGAPGGVALGHCPNLGGFSHCWGLDPCQPFGGGQMQGLARGCHAFPAGWRGLTLLTKTCSPFQLCCPQPPVEATLMAPWPVGNLKILSAPRSAEQGEVVEGLNDSICHIPPQVTGVSPLAPKVMAREPSQWGDHS